MNRLDSGTKNPNNFFAWATFLIQKIGTNSVIYAYSGNIKNFVRFPWNTTLKILPRFWNCVGWGKITSVIRSKHWVIFKMKHPGIRPQREPASNQIQISNCEKTNFKLSKSISASPRIRDQVVRELFMTQETAQTGERIL